MYLSNLSGPQLCTLSEEYLEDQSLGYIIRVIDNIQLGVELRLGSDGSSYDGEIRNGRSGSNSNAAAVSKKDVYVRKIASHRIHI